MSLIELRNVNVSLGGRLILEGLYFFLEPGQCWAVLGANGTGKSTFLRLLRGDIWPDVGGQRLYHFVGEKPRESPIGARELIALVSPEQQENYARFPSAMTGLDLVLSGFGRSVMRYNAPSVEQHTQAHQMLARLEIDALTHQDIRGVSTGQLRRLLMARALVGAPRLLVLDECFSGLDNDSKRVINELIVDLTYEHIPVVYTTHREDEMIETTSHALRLEAGRISEAGLYQRDKGISAVPRPRQTLEAAPRDEGVVVRVLNADVFLGQEDDTSATGFDGPLKQVLFEINLEMRAQQHWVWLGSNGAGKSTLAKLLAGEVSCAFGGLVERFDLPQQASIEAVRQEIAVVSPDLQQRFRLPISGRDVVASGFFGIVDAPPALDNTQVRRLEVTLHNFGLTQISKRLASEMSQGELKRCLIARALVNAPKLVILDEPFDYLDAKARDALMTGLEKLANGGTQFVVIAHRFADIPFFATHTLTLEDGRITHSGEIGAGGFGNA